ncbi:MAG TPA: DUF1801 domain-containing protein, partial [Actinomycetales bacterium]|nr:DUF1801 domain-containing protein [Actinomycetales bacterium]
MQSDATTVEQYLAELADDRRPGMTELVRVIDDNLPDGFERA